MKVTVSTTSGTRSGALQSAVFRASFQTRMDAMSRDGRVLENRLAGQGSPYTLFTNWTTQAKQ